MSMDYYGDDAFKQKQELAMPLLEECSRIKCVKFPLVYHVLLPRAMLIEAVSPGPSHTKRLHFGPFPAFADVLEVLQVQSSSDVHALGGQESHNFCDKQAPPGLGYLQRHDRLTHVNGRIVHSLKHVQEILLEMEEDGACDSREARDKGSEVRIQLLRKKNPYAVYMDVDDPASPSTSSSSSSSDSCHSFHEDSGQTSSLLALVLSGGGCISFSPSSPSFASLVTSGAGPGSSRRPCRVSSLESLQPYESWGDEASLERTHYMPLWCFPLFLYLVQAGDSLPSIARTFGVSVDVLRRDNRDKFRLGEAAGVLSAGQKLRVRNRGYDARATAAMVASGGWEGGREGGKGRGQGVEVPSSEGRRGELHGEQKSGVWAGAGGTASREPGCRHVVRRGETLQSLCAQYGVDALELRRRNRRHFPVGEKGEVWEGMCLSVGFALPREAGRGGPGAGGQTGREREAAPPPPASPSPVGALWRRTALPSKSSAGRGARGGGGSEDGGRGEIGGRVSGVLSPAVEVGRVV